MRHYLNMIAAILLSTKYKKHKPGFIRGLHISMYAPFFPNENNIHYTAELQIWYIRTQKYDRDEPAHIQNFIFTETNCWSGHTGGGVSSQLAKY